MAGNPSTTAQFFDILIPVITYHHLSNPPKLIHTSIPYVAVATSLLLRFGPTEKRSLVNLGNLRDLRQPRWNLQMAIGDGWLGAMSVLIGQYIC